ncbi:hypothetical protein ACOME3_004442 [Neoechinorhynchus agilis]
MVINELILFCVSITLFIAAKTNKWSRCKHCFQFKIENQKFCSVRPCKDNIKGNVKCVALISDNIIAQHSKYLRFGFGNCGKRKKMILENPFMNRNRCVQGEFPWLVRIDVWVAPTIKMLCAGAMIHRQWIITAAHCFVGSFYDRKPARRFLIEKYIPNPHFHLFDSNTTSDDLLLIKLKIPIWFSDNVKAICLPPPDTEFLNGTSCNIAGWGKTSERNDQPSLSAIKSKSHVVMVENDKGMNICEGDSGTPLACEGKIRNSFWHSPELRYYIFGVASYGYPLCNKDNKRNFFADIVNNVDWITEMILEF